MAFREVSVFEVREVLRLWLSGYGFRTIARLSGVDRKTVRRYVGAAQQAGLAIASGEEEITDELVGEVVGRARPARPQGHGKDWERLDSHRGFLEEKIKAKLRVTKIHDLFLRHARAQVSYPTLRRYLIAEFGYGRKTTTVRIADCDPGEELQVDFGRMGLVPSLETGKRRMAWALIFTAVFSRHMFVWLTFRQTLESVIEGFEAAFQFFGGVFKVVIPDNLKAIVIEADSTNPRLNPAFLEYAQSRGFVIDPARVGKPKDKARVERMVPFVRESFFKGEEFKDLPDAQLRGESWCLNRAGLRVHGTTQRRPLEVFDLEEKDKLLPAPTAPYDLPVYAEPKVHPDRHVEVAKALYSVPGDLVGSHVVARADRNLVKIFHRGQLIKTHPRKPPGGRSTDPNDLPQEKTAYAMRDVEGLKRLAFSYGKNIGAYADALLDNPLPWTRMRQVYRLLGLVRRFGNARVEEACTKALEFEAVDVSLIARMVERALENAQLFLPDSRASVVDLRFARPAEEFEIIRGGFDGSNR